MTVAGISPAQSEDYEISPLFRLDREPSHRTWRLVAGQGANREALDCNSPQVISWLSSLIGRRQSLATLADSASGQLRLELTDAEKLVDTLTRAQVLVTSEVACRLRTMGEQWERWGWRDAFDFHFSVRGMPWDKTAGFEEYQATLRGLLEDTSESGPQPETFKTIETDTYIDLAPLVAEYDSKHPEGHLLSDALQHSTPITAFTEPRIDGSELAKLLHAAHGVQATRNLVLGEHIFRASPSGGARHPVEIYAAVRNVTGIPPAVYHYEQRTNRLAMLRGPDALAEVDATCFDKTGIKTSPVVLYLTYRFIRHAWKYRYSRTYRMVLMEVGHNVQATHIAACLMGFDTYCSPAIDDYLVSKLLNLPDDCAEGPMYSIGLGRGGVILDEEVNK